LWSRLTWFRLRVSNLPSLLLSSDQIFSSAPCSQTLSVYVRFEAFTAVTMKNVFFWDVTQPPAHSGSLLADFSTMKMGRYVPPKRRLTQDIHSVTSQKTTFFTLSLCTSLNVRNQVSHPCRTTGKIIVLYILIFMFLDSRREDRRF
jgi:hypothetical protein